MVVNFKSRKEAEAAYIKGRTFQDRLLSVNWISGHHLHHAGGNTGINTSMQLSSRTEQPSVTDEDIDLEVNFQLNDTTVYEN